MTANILGEKSDLFMDVDNLDFLKDSITDINDESYMDEDNFGIDEVSGAIETQFEGEQPIKEPLSSFRAEGKALQFRVGPVLSHSLGFVSGKCQDASESKLYTPNFHGIDTTENYKQYIMTCFEIYKNLGEDRFFSVPTMGLINHSAPMEHSQAVNMAIDAMADELEVFSGTQKPARAAELEECLAIINCSRALHFTDGNDNEEANSAVLKQLTQWVNRADGEPSEEAVAEAFSGSVSYKSPLFWRLVNQLLLRGLFDQAIGVLDRSHLLKDIENTCEITFNVLNDAISLLKQYPFELGEAFREWKATALQISQFFVDSTTNVDPELRDFVSDMILLMSGNQSKTLQYSRTWYESFCGLMLFYIPTLELTEEYLQISLKAHPLDVCNNWEQACVYVIQGKLYAVLPILESLDYCTAVFYSAICEAKGLLENSGTLMAHSNGSEGLEGDLFSSNNSMACYLMHEFALELCCYEDKNLWSVGIGILALSPSDNDSAKRLAIAELLPHYPFQNNDDIEWLLTLCAKWRLPDVAKTIYRILGNKVLYENNVIEAMTNFSKAGEFEWVKHYSWMIFEASAMKGAPLEDMIIDAIVSGEAETEVAPEILESVMTNAMRQTLSPYAVLYQFYQQRVAHDWEGALSSLVSLLEFRYMPKHYISLLVAQFLYPTFLKDDTVAISEDMVIRIIKTLDRVSTDDKSVALYEALKSGEGRDDEGLPKQLGDLLPLVRQRLSYKICQEYMSVA